MRAIEIVKASSEARSDVNKMLDGSTYLGLKMSRLLSKQFNIDKFTKQWGINRDSWCQLQLMEPH